MFEEKEMASTSVGRDEGYGQALRKGYPSGFRFSVSLRLELSPP
jgi:hypothetical protein